MKLTRTHKRLAVAAVIALVALFVLADRAKDIANALEERRTIGALEKFAALCLERFPAETVSDEIVSLRHCVNLYSRFDDTDFNEPVWHDKVGTAEWLFAYASEQRSEPPPMECFYRSHTLRRILEGRGISSRAVTVAQNVDNYYDHVVIEIDNPETSKSEIHDVLYDMNFERPDGTRLGMRDLLTMDKADYHPCNADGQCGWKITSREKLVGEDLLGYWNVAYDQEHETLLVSKSRFDEKLQRPVRGKTQSYCEWRDGWCEKVSYVE